MRDLNAKIACSPRVPKTPEGENPANSGALCGVFSVLRGNEDWLAPRNQFEPENGEKLANDSIV